jgi:rfaE bifunctional protein nucleotidyltransferase chain/domain
MRVSRTNTLSGTKVKSLGALKKTISLLKRKGKKIVFTNGCFDLLHYGHIKYLEHAKAKGDILIVAINSDDSVKRIKGDKRPLVSEFDRARVIASLACVDYVVIFVQDTPFEVIAALRPDVLIKGSDWAKQDIVGADIVKSDGGKVLTVKLAKGRSTTNLIRAIVETYKS